MPTLSQTNIILESEVEFRNMKDEKVYPIGGYAPGGYQCKCSTCETQFLGNREAFQCEPCAIKDKEFFDAMTPEQQKRFDGRFREIANLFFLNLKLKEENERLRKALEIYVSWNIEESQRMGYYKNHLNSPLYRQGQEALKQQP